MTHSFIVSSLQYCDLNQEDVKENGCPKMYSLCSNIGESMCCGGNAYNCMKADPDNLLFGDESETAHGLFSFYNNHDSGFWIMNDCKAAADSQCKVDKAGRATCILDECTHEYSVEGSYNCDYIHYEGICTFNEKYDQAYQPTKVYCCDYSDGKSYKTVTYIHSLDGINRHGSCSSDGTFVPEVE